MMQFTMFQSRVVDIARFAAPGARVWPALARSGLDGFGPMAVQPQRLLENPSTAVNKGAVRKARQPLP